MHIITCMQLNHQVLYPPINVTWYRCITKLTVPLLAVVLSPAVATTTLPDPGPLCAGQTAVLTCSVTDGVAIEWGYKDGYIGQFLSLSQPPSPDPVTEGGVHFTLTLSQNNNPLISQLSFTASPDMDGGVVRCTGFSDAFSSDEITLQVEICKSIDDSSWINNN